MAAAADGGDAFFGAGAGAGATLAAAFVAGDGFLLASIFAYLSFKVAAGVGSKPAGMQRPQQRKSCTMNAPIKQSSGRTHVASATQSSEVMKLMTVLASAGTYVL